ncbi:2'-5' RNA ligase family protein [Paracoccus sp. TOH]|uniref:2'-5' RNA ligase family protein n=1 Tax=Paracoccus simplex TaxID=2086346 RepID=A0ABV7S3I5_9RHOB|nr:2'-5' RNA ligase family protein [Paracoccus sp. TOH]WJS86283.1 2'-5' RNA ligase family protein [Paracoccus sp. TOH]
MQDAPQAQGTPQDIPREHFLLFVVVPPPAVAARIEDAWRLAQRRDRFRRATLHMTILPVIRSPQLAPGMVEALGRPLDGLDFPAFDLVLDQLTTFGPPRRRDRPLVLVGRQESPAPDALCQTLWQRLAAAGLGAPKHRVTPHVTLAYGKPLPPEGIAVPPVHWRVDELTLIDSLQGLGRHVPLARWRLS